MVFDGRWKHELKKIFWEMVIWQKIPFYSDFVEHRLNRAVLYSATILRKIIEDEAEIEMDAKKTGISFKKSKIVHATLTAIKCPYVGKEGWTIRGKVFASDYGKGQEVSLNIKDVCNWLLHSYVWGLAYESDLRACAGYYVASDFDKEKFIHYISFDEWCALLKFVIQNINF